MRSTQSSSNPFLEIRTMKTRMLAVALALAAAPVPALAQQPTTPQPAATVPGARRQHPRPRRDAASTLLRHRQQLDLTADQVARLEAIRQRARSQNQPLVRQIRNIRERAVPGLREHRGELTADQRASLKATRPQVMPLVKQIRDNEKAARQEAAAVLTAQQKQRIESLRAARRASRGDGG
jgi:Spy/CpxP family protein refolding chaperone